MFAQSKRFLFLSLIALVAFFGYFVFTSHSQPSPTTFKIAIASYGPHHSLEATIAGIKTGLAKHGLNADQEVKFYIQDVNFDTSLIRQMLAKLQALHPDILVTLTTPVTQAAKNQIHDIPIVFSAITDPQTAGLLADREKYQLTGTSDQQDLVALLQFAKTLLPQAKKVGLLYATSEANDAALVKMMEKAAIQVGLNIMALPIEHPRDIPFRMQSFAQQVDFIYVGVSGPIQPSLPAIVATADKLQIPVFNADKAAVFNHQVLASYGVSYEQVGENTAELIFQILQGKKAHTISPVYPLAKDHQAYISEKRAQALGITIPQQSNLRVVN